MEADLAAVLDRYNGATLNQLAAFHRRSEPGSQSKLVVIPKLVDLFTDPAYIKRAYADLSKTERGLLDALLRRGGTAPTRTLRETLRRQKLIDPSKPRAVDHRAVNSRFFEDALARLTLRGLVFALDSTPPGSIFGGPNAKFTLADMPANVFIPAATQSRLPTPAPEVRPAAPPPPVQAVQAGSARVLQRDLYLYWSYVLRHPLTLTAKDEPHKTALREVGASLLERAELGKGEGELDRPRLRFVRLLLADLDLVHPAGLNQWEAREPAEFFALAAAERVRLSFEAWQHSATFSEIVLLPRDVRPAKLTPAHLTPAPAVQQARLALLRAVAEVASGAWLAFDAVLEHVHETDYEFLIARQPPNRYNYYFNAGPYSSSSNPFGADFRPFKSVAEGWEQVEANLVRGLVAGPLVWLGLADLGWAGAAEGPATAFRLTPLGLWVLGRGPQPEIPAEGGRVIVQPNLHIVALDPVNDSTLVTLDRFAERLSAERAVEYQLSRASVYAGQQAGWDVDRIKAFLRAQTGVDLPGNVARTLDEWQAQHQRIVLRPAVTLVHGPAELLSALAAVPALAAQVAGRPAPEVLRLASAAGIAPVVEAVGAQGSLPVVTTQPAVPPNAVLADEAGHVRLLTRRPNLYLHGRLAAFADPAGETAYHISAASISRAARAGLGAAEVEQQLAGIHRGPLPAALVRRLRAWAKHYGDAAAESVVLLQVRDAATLAELSADPELAPLLQPFKPKAHLALARVRAEDLDKLRARLADRGIDLKPKLE